MPFNNLDFQLNNTNNLQKKKFEKFIQLSGKKGIFPLYHIERRKI